MGMIEQQPGYGPPTPVPIFQWEKEFAVIIELYRRIAPKRVLEVGTYHGGTLYHWLQNSRRGTHVVSLDSYAVGVDNSAMYDEWIPRGVMLDVIKGDCHSPRIIRQVNALGPYDWAFIDAGHYLKEVTKDWRNYGPMVKEGGFVIFHDILPPSEQWPDIEVALLWDEIRREHLTMEIVNDRTASWGGIGIVLA